MRGRDTGRQADRQTNITVRQTLKAKIYRDASMDIKSEIERPTDREGQTGRDRQTETDIRTNRQR